MAPLQIKIEGRDSIIINWDDETESRIKLTALRLNCPCALCASDRENNGNQYFPILSNEQLTVTNISIIGNYAVGISWMDGHNTGIYEFSYLKKLSKS
ncbi:MAG TPA: DUF971 domain-containing protein [Melioribacteraceae bacterium]|nr:DUF971 domain-containing protein [Melioribacteraceae bacterium]